ncbi:MAG TPA: ParB/RepB/Spo0J family partition protein [Coleofasciculaceae cyanobacterium]
MTNFDGILARMQQKKSQSQAPKVAEATLSLDAIKQRDQDTRPLNPGHVESLAESIAVLGLIEPLVTDSQGRLLAGGHRLAAIALLKEKDPDAFMERFLNAQIPVRMLPFDAEEDPDLALQVEVAENEKRRDYTPAEVKAVADRLRAAGYSDLKGRPRKGDKPMMPALQLIIGKSLRTVQRYLSEDEEQESKSMTDVVLLQQILTKLQKWQRIHKPTTEAEQALAKLFPKVEKAISHVLEQEK